MENPDGKIAKISSILLMLKFFKKNYKKYSNIEFLINDIQSDYFNYSNILEIVQHRWSEKVNYNTNHLCNFINWVLGKNINSLKLKKIEIESLNFNWVLIDYGREWLDWVLLAERWLEISKENLSHKKRVLKTFFINYLVKTPTCGDVETLYKGTQNWSMNEKDLIQKLGNVSPGSLKHKRSYFTTVVTFLDWVADNVLSSKILNPISKNIFKDNEPIYLLISTLGPMWSEWGILIKKWMIDNP
ncbi:VPA1269 family protein, partial [Acinetobacter pittii]|uniref:VPA1269 family protein n=1 Tax=Acinetobacter pittii TaxID=48296 RepID=UPI001111DB29